MTRATPLLLLVTAALGFQSRAAQADWLDWVMKQVSELRVVPPVGTAVLPLSEEEIGRGLKEALSVGTRRAIAQLGREGGYLDNARVRIPLPDNLAYVERTLRALGQGKLVDEFTTTLNRAAERAVPEAASIFADALGQMTLQDARGILSGPDDVATLFFRRSGEAKLLERFQPIVQEATDKAGVTANYKRLMLQMDPFAQYLGKDAGDLDGYITRRALDGLFLMVAEEERRIRTDPLARGTELLKKVFGASRP